MTFFVKSPLATALQTVAMSLTSAVRLAAIVFTLSVKSFHVPPIPCTLACTPRVPSVPTMCATRVTSEANKFNWLTGEGQNEKKNSMSI